MQKSLLSFFIIITLVLSITINAQQTVKCFVGCNLQAGSVSHMHYTPPPFDLTGKTAEVEVTFVNATAEQKSAVNYAVEIWSSILVSDAPIKILVTFYPMPSFLGQCVSNLVKNFPGAPANDTWYVSSLADAVTAVDQQPENYDMDIFLSSAVNWYYGLDGNCPSNKFDLVDVALHEMGQGLGYIDNGTGSYGYITTEVLTRPIAFAFPELKGLPTSYDKHIFISNNEFITDTTLFSNPSEDLKNLFVGNDLFFEGEFSTAVNNNNHVKLYAPSTFIFASSLLHFDEDTYPPGNVNTLMTPYVDYGEANHNPGPVTFGLLKDLGWTLNDSITVDVSDDNLVPTTFSLSQNYPNPFNPTTTIKFTIGTPPVSSPFVKGRTEERFVTLRVYDVLGREVKTLINKNLSPGNYEVEFDASDLPS